MMVESPWVASGTATVSRHNSGCRMLLILLLGTTFGCSQRVDLPDFYRDLVPVTGVILQNKQPLAGAIVTFYPIGEQAERPAYGETDQDGKFRLMTPIRGLSPDRSQGAIPGTYRILVSKYLMPDGSPLTKEISHADAELQGAKESIPAKYNDQMNSTLSAEVQAEAAENHFEFAL